MLDGQPNKSIILKGYLTIETGQIIHTESSKVSPGVYEKIENIETSINFKGE